jgi:hypothetical protein
MAHAVVGASVILQNCYGISAVGTAALPVVRLEMLENDAPTAVSVPCFPGTQVVRVDVAPGNASALSSTTQDLCSGARLPAMYGPARDFSGVDCFSQELASPIGAVTYAGAVVFVAHVDQPPVFTSAGIIPLSVGSATTNASLDLSAFVHDVDNTQSQLRVIAAADTSVLRSVAVRVRGLTLTVTPGALSTPLWTHANTGSPVSIIALTVLDPSNLTATGIVAVNIACGASEVVNVWSSGSLCLPCPAGAFCSTAGAKPNALPGWTTLVEGDGTQLFVACRPAEACCGNGTCCVASGYVNTLSSCGNCATGWYKLGTCSIAAAAPRKVVGASVVGIYSFAQLAIVRNRERASDSGRALPFLPGPRQPPPARFIAQAYTANRVRRGAAILRRSRSLASYSSCLLAPLGGLLPKASN